MAEDPRLVEARKWNKAVETLISLADARTAERTANADIQAAMRALGQVLGVTQVFVVTDADGDEWAFVQETRGLVDRRKVVRLN